ncbi:GGDEF domain-containing protein [Deinococcus ruber]|uniref:GGDEF domain-containing protein n=1 Tax=Deinococcus ruber TaxID=1848197 RepID=A0A918F5S2_9DEIO|nr:GGDEF domain-containing protein [Deinococcus ruber]GGR11550.1 hypothetical protein GCM10008957_25620 [Deinococcus ruber]
MIEAQGRRVYVLLATLACLGQLGISGLDLVYGSGLRWDSLYGAVLCGALIPLLRKRLVPLHMVDYGLVAAASLGLAILLYGAYQHDEPPTPRMYFIGIFLFLAAYRVLPSWFANGYSAVLYAVFVVLTVVKRGDLTLVVELAMVVLLIMHLSMFGRRVTANRIELAIFERLARTDVLTGLENRRAMYERLDHAFNRGQHDAAVLLFDIDFFKAVNDQYGHPVGDEVLQAVAAILQRVNVHPYAVSRWGGEEFLVLLEAAMPQEAVATAQRVLAEIRIASMPHAIRLTASCGVACAKDATSVAAWLLCADEHLYAAKAGGRDRVHPVIFQEPPAA